jgi:hypothetical protein
MRRHLPDRVIRPISAYQRELLALISQHGPVSVQSRGNGPSPRLMLDGTLWASLQATDALQRRGLIERLDDGRLQLTANSGA